MSLPIRISQGWTGLCNQLFATINGVLLARKQKKKTIELGPFCACIHKKNEIPASKVLDLPAMNQLINIQLKDGKQDKNYWKKIKFRMGWYSWINKTQFDLIIHSLRFNPKFYQLADQLTKDITGPINVVHLRVEEDGIKHWSKMNKLPPKTFRTRLHNKYRKQIADSIPKGSNLIVLCGDHNHTLINEFKNNYKVYTFDHSEILNETFGFSGREVSAILDLLIGAKCDNIFMGCHNLQQKRGSTFSYMLYKMMDNKMSMFIDLDKIDNPVELV